MYLNRTRRVFPSDYPMLFWLNKCLVAGHTRVADLGGHIGVSYYSYAKYLDFPEALRWQVHDVPAVVQRGRQVAQERHCNGSLEFVDSFKECDGAEVLIASGSLQYLPESLPDLLAGLLSPPMHLLLNLVPLHASRSYVTLQSIGTAFCPYRIGSINAFVNQLELVGYTRVDQWENPEKSCVIPFYKTHSLDKYYGFYFVRHQGSSKHSAIEK